MHILILPKITDIRHRIYNHNPCASIAITSSLSPHLIVLLFSSLIFSVAFLSLSSSDSEVSSIILETDCSKEVVIKERWGRGVCVSEIRRCRISFWEEMEGFKTWNAISIDEQAWNIERVICIHVCCDLIIILRLESIMKEISSKKLINQF